MAKVSAAVSAFRQKSLQTARRAGEKSKQAAKRQARQLKSKAVGMINKKKVPTWIEIILFALPLAIVNDALDIMEVTGILKIVTIIIDIFTAIILFVWFWFRAGDVPNKKLAKFALTAAVEFIPLAGIIPTWSPLVLDSRLGLLRFVPFLSSMLVLLNTKIHWVNYLMGLSNRLLF